MTDFHAAIQDAIGTAREVAGVPAIYVYGREPGEEVETLAIPGHTEFEVLNSDGVVIRLQSRDFIIDAAVLVDLSGESFLPARGHRILEQVAEHENGKRYTVYEVMRLDKGEDIWRYANPRRTAIRIHTKRLGEVER